MLFRAEIHTSREVTEMAIVEGETLEAVVAKIIATKPAPEGQEWVKHPVYEDDGAWMIFDSSLHISVDDAAEDQSTTVLIVEPITIGVWWDPGIG